MKRYVPFALLVILAMLANACAAPTPQVIEKQVEKVVTQIVEKPVVQTQVVEKSVEKIVEKVVTPTPLPPTQVPQVKEGGTLNLHLEAAPPSLYPPSDADRLSQMVQELVYDYLMFFNDAQEVVPELADTYKVSEDGLTYTVGLRKDVKWHDGQPFTARDVKFSFEQACSKFSGYFADYKDLVGCQDYRDGKATEVKGIEIVDDYTLKFRLAQPNAAFPLALVYRIIPEHIYKGMDLDTAKRAAWKPVGTGPFKLVDYKEDQYFEFDAYSDYFKGAPHINKVFMKIAKADTAIAMLERGEVDFIADLPADEVERLQANPNIKILETNNNNWPWGLQINVTKPGLGDKRVRQAMMYAIDRQAYVDGVLQGHGQVTSLPWQTPGWALPDAKDVNQYPYDVEKAKGLLKEAGWDPNRVVEILAYPGNKLRYEFAVIAQQYLADAGIRSNIVTMDVARAIEKINASDFDVLLTGAGAKPDPASQAMYYTCDSTPDKGGYNNGGFCDPAADELFKKGSAAFTSAERAPIYKELAKVLNEDAPWMWLASPNYVSASNSRIADMKYNPNLTEGRYFDIENWKLAQ
jgi:peptide/nickel transport system substrate-binding protein